MLERWLDSNRCEYNTLAITLAGSVSNSLLNFTTWYCMYVLLIYMATGHWCTLMGLHDKWIFHMQRNYDGRFLVMTHGAARLKIPNKTSVTVELKFSSLSVGSPHLVVFFCLDFELLFCCLISLKVHSSICSVPVGLFCSPLWQPSSLLTNFWSLRVASFSLMFLVSHRSRHTSESWSFSYLTLLRLRTDGCVSRMSPNR